MRSAGYCMAVLAATLLAGTPAEARKSKAQGFAAEQVEKAEFRSLPKRGRASPLALKIQVFLARAHASPGQIDGTYGASTVQALKSFQMMEGLEPNGVLTKAVWSRLRDLAGAAPVFKEYEIKDADVKGPFVDRI